MQILLVLPAVARGHRAVADRAALRTPLETAHASSRPRCSCTIVGSAVTQLLQGNDIGNYLRVLLPFLLMLLGYFVACHPWNQDRLEQIEKVMFWSMVVLALLQLRLRHGDGRQPRERALPDRLRHVPLPARACCCMNSSSRNG